MTDLQCSFDGRGPAAWTAVAQDLALRSRAWWLDCWRGLFPGAAPLPTVKMATQRARYRHPLSGHSWDGHGRQPRWLQQAVLVEGYTVEALRRAARQGWVAATTA